MNCIPNTMRGEYTISLDFLQKVAAIKEFHHQMPNYHVTPLVKLGALAKSMELDGTYIKDESQRFGLKAFKVLGGSYAIYRFIMRKTGSEKLHFDEITSRNISAKTGKLTFATATDGNHGKGVAYVANKLGFKAEIYVPKATVPSRIEAIEQVGGRVTVIDGNYDKAVRQMAEDAAANDWIIISDTSWEGYKDIPEWVMQGYYTIFDEAREQLEVAGAKPPTHIFIQGGVGTLPASLVDYFRQVYVDEKPRIIIVEPENAACLFTSAEKADGTVHEVKGKLDTMMAGLACGKPNPLAWNILKKGADFFIKADDSVAAEGMQTYFNPIHGDQKIISGESGAVTMGVLKQLMTDEQNQEIKNMLALNEKSRVLLVNTERDTDPENFRRIVSNR